jgi:hypothetical protein
MCSLSIYIVGPLRSLDTPPRINVFSLYIEGPLRSLNTPPLINVFSLYIYIVGPMWLVTRSLACKAGTDCHELVYIYVYTHTDRQTDRQTHTHTHTHIIGLRDGRLAGLLPMLTYTYVNLYLF